MVKIYKEMVEFGGDGIIPMLQSVVVATSSLFFPIFLLFLWLMGSAGIYYAVMKTSGKKRFWHANLAMSFICFLLSLLLALLNTSEVVVLSGYWVVFYIMTTSLGFLILNSYK